MKNIDNIRRIGGQSPLSNTMLTLQTLSEIFTEKSALETLKESYPEYFTEEVLLDKNGFPDPTWLSDLALSCALIHTGGNRRAAAQIRVKLDRGAFRLAYRYLFPHDYKNPFTLVFKNDLKIEERKNAGIFFLKLYRLHKHYGPVGLFLSSWKKFCVKSLIEINSFSQMHAAFINSPSSYPNLVR